MEEEADVNDELREDTYEQSSESTGKHKKHKKHHKHHRKSKKE